MIKKDKGIFVLLLAGFFLILTEKMSMVNVVVAFSVAIAVIYGSAKDTPDLSPYLSLSLLSRWIFFILILIREIVYSNVQVALIVLRPQMNIYPQIVRYVSPLKDDLLLTVLANAITLTPGTMTVEIQGSVLFIHCLNERYQRGLNHMKLEEILLHIEGGLHG